ncbi:Cytochrome c551 peroxidase precursor [compost metagenome]
MTDTSASTVKAQRVFVPADNPMTQAKIELGFRLWFEPRLSGNNKMNCATCHDHTKGFSNAERTAAGITGARGDRNVPTIYGIANNPFQFWDGRAKSLEEQALGPIENPIEMNAKLPDVIRKLETMEYYPRKFKEAFGTGVTADGIAKALATFERALTVEPTPFERYARGEQDAMSESAIRGAQIFHSPKGRCIACHSGPDLTDGQFHNLGVGLDRPNPDVGRYAVTKNEADWGAFKTPTLRNVALTAPYMHDGSLSTLEEVVAFYNKGGIPSANQDPRIGPLNLSEQDQKDLVAFLRALTSKDNLKEMGKLPGIH